mgnify:CR=1 FL=1
MKDQEVMDEDEQVMYFFFVSGGGGVWELCIFAGEVQTMTLVKM